LTVNAYAFGDEAVVVRAVEFFYNEKLLSMFVDELDAFGEMLQKSIGYFFVY